MKENDRNFVCWISCLFIHFYSMFLSSPPPSSLLFLSLHCFSLHLSLFLSSLFLSSSSLYFLPSFISSIFSSSLTRNEIKSHHSVSPSKKSWLNNSINPSSSSFLVPYYHVHLSLNSKWVKIWNVENDSEESQICWTFKEITFILKSFSFLQISLSL